MSIRCSRLLAVAALVCCTAGVAAAQNILDPGTLAPYVPTPQRVVEHMLEAAGVDRDDVVYDLGSGDGRILFTAVETFGARAVGIEINEALVKETNSRIEELDLAGRIEVRHQNFLEADLRPATVVTVYLLTSTNEQLKPKLEDELKPGARVVSHDFQFMGWTPAKMVEVPGQSRSHRIYVYEMGSHRAEE